MLIARRIFTVVTLFQFIFLLSGCNKIVDWGKANFEQASKYAQDFIRAAQVFIRSNVIYDEFTIVATFDTLFLTDQMRMLFVDYHKQHHGLTDEQESIMRKRLINENKYFISFYVVATQKQHIYENDKTLFTGSYQKNSEILGSKDATWNIRMKVGNKEYLPESIRIADLPMEFRAFFGTRLDQFSYVYLVRFAVQDAQGHLIFEPGKKYNVVLKYTSAIYKAEALWRNMVYTKLG